MAIQRSQPVELLHGNIYKTLMMLALPIMGTAFMQMSYNLVDLFWIGKLGAGAIAGVGAAGFFIWLADSISYLARTGGQVFAGQKLGAKEFSSAKDYARSALQLAFVLGVVSAALMIVYAKELIGFFQLVNPHTNEMGQQYLIICAIGFIFIFHNRTLSALSIGAGESKIPLYVNGIGLISNMILDPIFIFTLDLKVIGAALATIMAQGLVSVILSIMILRKEPYNNLHIFKRFNFSYYWEIFKLGLPTAMQTGLFCIASIVMGRIITSFGEPVIAAQRIGVQIESITWMIAQAFASAVCAFIAQNYGAKRFDRTHAGYTSSIVIVSILGLTNSVFLYMMAEPICAIFIDEPAVIFNGIQYLQIIALSQWFVCLEITISMAFSGYGKTVLPSIISTFFVMLRIPVSLWLISNNVGINGVWWTMTITSTLLGIVLAIAYHFTVTRKVPKEAVTLEE